MNNSGQETPANNGHLINMAESRPPVPLAEGARASLGATQSTEQAPYEAGNTSIIEVMKDAGAAPDYDKTPPPSGAGLRPMSASPEMSLSPVHTHPEQIEIPSIDSYGQSPKPQPELLTSTNEKALTIAPDKIGSINSFKQKKDPLMDEGWGNVGKAGEQAAGSLFPDAMALGKEPVTAEEQPAETQQANPTEIPPMTPEQTAKIEEAAKDAVGPSVFKHIMKGAPKHPLN